MAYNNQEPQTHLRLNARKINEGQREDYPGKVMRENMGIAGQSFKGELPHTVAQTANHIVQTGTVRTFCY